MKVCPKCGYQTLAQEECGTGIYERHVRCYTCGLLHVRGAGQDSIKRQVNPELYESEWLKKQKTNVHISD